MKTERIYRDGKGRLVPVLISERGLNTKSNLLTVKPSTGVTGRQENIEHKKKLAFLAVSSNYDNQAFFRNQKELKKLAYKEKQAEKIRKKFAGIQ